MKYVLTNDRPFSVVCVRSLISVLSPEINIGAATSENVPPDMCAQQRFRSACAFAQSDQNPFWAHFGLPRMQCFFMRTTKTDQTAQMRRLIWVFVERTHQKVHFLVLRQIEFKIDHRRCTMLFKESLLVCLRNDFTTGFDISCKLSPMETICMISQILLSWKNNKPVINLSSA